MDHRDRVLLRRLIRKQVDEHFEDISVEQRIALTEGLIDPVGHYRVGVKLHAFSQGKLGKKAHLYRFHAVADCCRLWSEVTGRDWRKVDTRSTASDRDVVVNRHPPIILARILIESATGKPRVASLDHVFRLVQGLSELPHWL